MFYINLYLFFSIIGYIFEEILMFFLDKPYNSSVLYGPWTSVYGFAIYIMLFIYIIIKKFNFSKLKEKIVYFFSSAIFLSLIEEICGFIIEKTRHVVYWNYDNYYFNIGHYISLESSLMWGMLALISMYLIIPRIQKILNKIPNQITILLLLTYLIDVVISCTK